MPWGPLEDADAIVIVGTLVSLDIVCCCCCCLASKAATRWRNLSASLWDAVKAAEGQEGGFDVVVACENSYDANNIRPLWRAASRLLHADGVLILARELRWGMLEDAIARGGQHM